jgi:arginase
MGAGRRGVDMGVSALRLAGLAEALERLGHQVEDCGNIEVPIVETIHDEAFLRYGGLIAQTCKRAHDWCESIDPSDFAIILGGDHSLSMGSISGLASHGRTGVIWIDAHTDINTPDTSPSGNLHGMPVAHLLGRGDERMMEIWGGGAVVRPEDIIYIGLRSVDGEERRLINDLHIRAFTMKEIDEKGIAYVARHTIDRLSHLDRIHVSFDVDVLDPSIAPGVGTPVRGGLTYREAHLLMELLSEPNFVTSLDVVEVNPILDNKNSTASIAVEMVSSLLGKGII